MREIVDQVLQAEKGAESIIQTAHNQETEIIGAAEKESNSKLQHARSEAQELIRKETDKSRQEADRRYQEAVRRAEEEHAGFLQNNQVKVDSIVAKIVTLILSTDIAEE